MAKVQNPSFIESKKQFFGPPFGAKNAPPGIAKARAAGGKALAKGVAVPPVQADTLQSGGIDNAGDINQGLFKGQKGLKVRMTSDGYMKKGK